MRECVITGFNFSSIILFLEDEHDINLMFSLNISTPDDGSVSECRIAKCLSSDRHHPMASNNWFWGLYMVQETKKTLKDKRHTICCGLLDACAHYQILEKLACLLDPHANLQWKKNTCLHFLTEGAVSKTVDWRMCSAEHVTFWIPVDGSCCCSTSIETTEWKVSCVSIILNSTEWACILLSRFSWDFLMAMLVGAEGFW